MKVTLKKKALPWLWLSFFIIAVDQWTKYLAVHHLVFGRPIKIFPWLNLTLNCNTGAAFSFLDIKGGRWVYFFALISLVVSVFLIVSISRTQRSDKWRSVGLSLIIGGAFGNFIDRVRLGYVIDFIDFHIKNWHYATFNVADSAIFVVAFLLIITMLFASRPS